MIVIETDGQGALPAQLAIAAIIDTMPLEYRGSSPVRLFVPSQSTARPDAPYSSGRIAIDGKSPAGTHGPPGRAQACVDWLPRLIP